MNTELLISFSKALADAVRTLGPYRRGMDHPEIVIRTTLPHDLIMYPRALADALKIIGWRESGNFIIRAKREGLSDTLTRVTCSKWPEPPLPQVVVPYFLDNPILYPLQVEFSKRKIHYPMGRIEDCHLKNPLIRAHSTGIMESDVIGGITLGDVQQFARLLGDFDIADVYMR